MVSPIVFQTMCTDSNSVSCKGVSILIGRGFSCHESRCWFKSGLTRIVKLLKILGLTIKDIIINN